VFNPALEVLGLLTTLHDKRTRSAREITEVLYGDTYAELHKFPFVIPCAVAFTDASLEGRSLVGAGPRAGSHAEAEGTRLSLLCPRPGGSRKCPHAGARLM
jgi:hypothetical protein